MEIITSLRTALADLLDIPGNQVLESTYLARDLNIESIDLLELALIINRDFNISVNEGVVFLRSLRGQLIKANKKDEETIQSLYPYLRPGRSKEIVKDLDKGPVLKISDIIDYIQYELDKCH